MLPTARGRPRDPAVPLTMGQTITVIVESGSPFEPTGTFDLEVTTL